MTFEIGDKVLTNTGLYMNGAWREAGLKGKVVGTLEEYGEEIPTVKFKGLEELRFLRPEYLIIREKAKKAKRPFKEGDTVATTQSVYTDTYSVSAGADAEVLEVIPDSNLVVIEFLHGGEATVPEDVLTKTEVVEDTAPAPRLSDHWGAADESLIVPGAEIVVLVENTEEECYDPDFVQELTTGIIRSVDTESRTVVAKLTDEGEDFSYTDTLDFDEFTVVEPPPVKESTEVQDALALVLERIEEIKTLLTTKPQNEFVINVHPSNGLTEEEVAAAVQEEPAPEPVFKKAKAVVVGDLLYTEGGAYDKVDRIDTKASGYTSLYGTFGNRIAQIPSGRVVQVLEEVK